MEDLKTADELDVLLKFLDKYLRKDDIDDSWEKYEAFEKLEREAGQSINDYIANFEWQYSRMENKGMELPIEEGKVNWKRKVIGVYTIELWR